MSSAVVTIVHGRHDHLVAQHRSLARGSRPPDHYVVVAMEDPSLSDWQSEDGPHPDVVAIRGDPVALPLARARNSGVAHALSLGAEDLILLDVDCLAGPDLVTGYVDALRAEPGTVWSGPVTYLPPPAREGTGYDLDALATMDCPHPGRPAPQPKELIQNDDPDLFWSLSFALRASTWRQIGGFCESYVGYGGEDTDFGRQVVHSGLRLGWAGSPRAYHQYHAHEDPPVQHLDAILRNSRLFHARWDDWPMTGWLRAFEQRGLLVHDEDGWRKAGPGTA